MKEILLLVVIGALTDVIKETWEDCNE